MAPGNSGTHLVKIVRAADGTDVPGGAVSINTAGGTPGRFVYAALTVPVTLDANSVYFILSQEAAGGDRWYDKDSTIQGTSAGTVGVPVYSSGSSYVYAATGLSGQAYGPLDFQYGGNGSPSSPSISQPPQNVTVLVGQTTTFTLQSTGSSPLSYQWQSKAAGASSFSNIPGATSSSYTTPAAQVSDNGTQFQCVVSNNAGIVSSGIAIMTVQPIFVTAKKLGTLRNNFSGWVGMAVQTGSAPLAVNALGRIMAPGNSGAHMTAPMYRGVPCPLRWLELPAISCMEVWPARSP